MIRLFVLAIFVRAGLTTTVQEKLGFQFFHSESIRDATENTNIYHPSTPVGGNIFLPPLPYNLILKLNGKEVCGVTYAKDNKSGGRFALTAAECVEAWNGVETVNATVLMTVTGGNLLNEEDNSGATQVLVVSKILVHPEFHRTNEGGVVNDIALLLLSGVFKENKFLQPIALPTDDFVWDEVVVTAGCGRQNVKHESKPFQKYPPFIHDIIVKNNDCSELYTGKFGNNVIFSTNICIGNMYCSPYDNYDVCPRGGGYPLVILTEIGSFTEEVLVGISSWGHGCKEPTRPAVYSRVSNYSDWISTTMLREKSSNVF